MKPQKLKRGKGISMMIFGVPGSGKTRLIGTGKKQLIVRPPTDHTDSIPDDADVQEIIVADWDDMLTTFQDVQQGLGEEYDWVWLDSISLFQEWGLADVFRDAVARKPARAEYGPDKGEYGINMGRLATWVRDMVALAGAGKFNFGVTAHPFEWFDPVAQGNVWMPYIQGQNMAPKLCGYMNVVGYLQTVTKDDKRQTTLLTEAEGFFGKDQYHCFPELKSGKRGMVSPTMPKIEKAIKDSRQTNKPARRTRKRRTKKGNK